MTGNSEAAHDHVTPLWVYLGVGGALLVLTVVTVAVAVVNFGELIGFPQANLVVALAIATLKASLVVLFFMHVFYDNKLYAVSLAIGLIMLAIFIVLTMFDTLKRDSIYPIEGQVISSGHGK